MFGTPLPAGDYIGFLPTACDLSSGHFPEDYASLLPSLGSPPVGGKVDEMKSFSLGGCGDEPFSGTVMMTQAAG